MKLNGYRIDDRMSLQNVAVDRIDRAAAARDGILWFDIEASQPAAIEQLLAPLELHPLALEGCAEPDTRMRVEPYEGAVLLSYPAGDFVQPGVPYTRILWLPNLLVTIRDRPYRQLRSLLDRADFRVHERSVAAILFLLFDLDQDDSVRATLELRDRIKELADRIEDDLDEVDGSDIRDLKRQAAAIAVRFEDQLACVSKLQQLPSDMSWLGELSEYYANLASNLDYLVRRTQRLEELVQDARYQYQAALQDKTNRRLNVLTVVQAIFVPLTLVTGIYGMNFAYMPELGWPMGYFYCLGLMAAIAAAELWVFYRKGWFD